MDKEEHSSISGEIEAGTRNLKINLAVNKNLGSLQLLQPLVMNEMSQNRKYRAIR